MDPTNAQKFHKKTAPKDKNNFIQNDMKSSLEIVSRNLAMSNEADGALNGLVMQTLRRLEDLTKLEEMIISILNKFHESNNVIAVNDYMDVLLGSIEKKEETKN